MTDTLTALLQWYVFGVLALALVMIGLHLTTRTKIDDTQAAAISLASIGWPRVLMSLIIVGMIFIARMIEKRLGREVD